MKAVLRVESGHPAGAVLELPRGGRTTLGRSHQAGFRIDDADVSRLHCTVENDGDALVVTDLGSSNGTFVDDVAVRRDRVPDGGVLRLGEVRLRLRMVPEGPAARFVGEAAPEPRHATTRFGLLEALQGGRMDATGALEDPAGLRALLRMVTASVALHGPDALARAAVEAAREGCGVDRLALVLLSPGGAPAEYCTAGAGGEPGGPLCVDAGTLHRVLDHGGCLAGPRACEGAASGARAFCTALPGDQGILGALWAEAEGPDPGPPGRSLAFLEAVGALVGAALARDRMQETVRRVFVGTIRSLVAVLDTRDRYTRGHSERVTRAALAVGEGLGLGPSVLEDLEIAALLHDVGKVGTREAVLQKPSRLDSDEYRAMQEHPGAGEAIVRNIRHPHTESIASAIRHHHERWDGTGYPDRLAGEAIPLEARILAVADTWDAMTSDRPYRKGLPDDQARAMLVGASGTQLDPVCVQALMHWLDAGSPASAADAPGRRRYVPTGMAPLPALLGEGVTTGRRDPPA